MLDKFFEKDLINICIVIDLFTGLFILILPALFSELVYPNLSPHGILLAITLFGWWHAVVSFPAYQIHFYREPERIAALAGTGMAARGLCTAGSSAGASAIIAGGEPAPRAHLSASRGAGLALPIF